LKAARIRLGACLVVALAVVVAGGVPQAGAFGGGLVISQVYGGGGNTGATYANDFVELYNPGDSAVSLDGLSIQYASASGTANFGASSIQLTELSGSIQPHRYFLVQEGTGGSPAAALPTPDQADTASPINMAAASGKVALVTGTTSLGCNGGSTPCDDAAKARIVDLVGYGLADFFEGSGHAPGASNATSVQRNGGGCTDTNDNAADFTAATPTPRNSSILHFCTAEDPPSVSSTSPANGATGVALDTNITINFSEPVNVSPGWYAIACGSSGAHAATVSGGPASYALDPATDFALSETCTVTVSKSGVADQDSLDPPDNPDADYVFSFTTAAPGPHIHEIQGASHISPFRGQTVAGVEGIVTALRLSSGRGFYMQDPAPDADDATSEGIFVFTNVAPTIAVGDRVKVNGTVSEFRPGGSSSTNLTTTEIDTPTVTVLSTGNALPAATVIGTGGRIPPAEVIEDDASGSVETSGLFDPASDGIDFYESLEGMRVQVNNAIAVGPTNNFGEIPVVGDGGAHAGLRTTRGGVIVRPSDFNPERIQLDDTLRSTPMLNVGDGFTTAVVGVMDYSFGNFKLNVTVPLIRVDGGLQREVTRAPRNWEIVVGTYNVENLDPGDGAAFARHADYIVNHLRSPDLLAIEEIQDDNGATNDSVTDASVTWNTLIAAIQAAGGPAYEYRQIDPVDDQDGGEPGGNIRVGFLFRTDRGLNFIDRPGGDATTPTTVVDRPSGPQLSFSPGRVDPQNTAWASSRKPLAGEFRMHGKKVFVVANHFNSKGGDQPLFGRFQPPARSSEIQRHAQAQVVNDFVDSILAADANVNVIVLGDINDFDFSETVNILEGGVLTTLMDTLPAGERYSYDFEGNSQVLDQILVSNTMLANFPIDYDPVHVNSEFADQASDHDPQVARLDLRGKPRP
jgi:predicted extracellular nuclease